METDPVILVVDRNRRNLDLLTQFLAKGRFRSLTAATVQEFDDALSTAHNIALVLVDLAGFDRTIWNRCERLRELKIPFIVLSPRHSAAIQQESLAHGAHGVLIKPLATKELLGLIRSLVRGQ